MWVQAWSAWRVRLNQGYNVGTELLQNKIKEIDSVLNEVIKVIGHSIKAGKKGQYGNEDNEMFVVSKD